MIYFGYPLDIHGWKPKPKTEPETKPKPEPENRGQKPTPNPKPEKPKPTDTRTEPDPLPSLDCSDPPPAVSGGKPATRRAGWGRLFDLGMICKS